MKNADMPASPCVNEHGAPVHYSNAGVHEGCMTGLTKREELAARNMAAILSSIPHWESMGYRVLNDSDYARQAIDAADALLAELDK